MKKNNIHVKRVIQRCGCDAILPLTLVYIFYIILNINYKYFILSF